MAYLDRAVFQIFGNVIVVLCYPVKHFE